MGDIAFNVIKDAALNKVVNLEIDKNVDVEVINNDLLATAEADAEVFGESPGLAETDAYTYVDQETGEGEVGGKTDEGVVGGEIDEGEVGGEIDEGVVGGETDEAADSIGIAFNITKDVALNKVVNLEIDKNVDVEVINNDLLATAEADAEAFGKFGLAETDAYTYVDQQPGEETFGAIDARGNTNSFVLGPDEGDGVGGESDGAADSIGITFADSGDVNGAGALANLSSPLPDTSNALLPDLGGLLSVSDLNLTQIGPAVSIEGGLEAEYTSDEDLVVDFGFREVDLNGNTTIEEGEAGIVTLTAPAGSLYLAKFTPEGGVEVELAELAEIEFDVIPPGEPPVFAPASAFFELEFASLDLDGSGNWAFEAEGDFLFSDGAGTGEAFSYTESSAALELNGDAIAGNVTDMTAVMTEV